MDLIKQFNLIDPPLKWVKVAKKKIDPDTGTLKTDTYYLSANLFYADKMHFTTRMQIVNFAKDFLMYSCTGLPKLEKIRLDVIYRRPDTNFDLDNKAYFWGKIFIDLLKTPTEKQRYKAALKGRSIKSLNVIKDDNVSILDEWNNKYEKGRHELIFKVYGRELSGEQKEMF